MDGGVELVDGDLHAGDGFEGDGVFEGFFGGAAPDEGGVAGDEDGGHIVGVEGGGAETFDDDFAGVEFVVGGNFGGGELAGAGDGAVEVVGVGGAEAGDFAVGLGEGGGVEGVGVDDAADVGEVLVEVEVGGGVGGGAVGCPLCEDLAGGEGEDDDVVGSEFFVGDAGGFDGDDAAAEVGGAVDGGGVAPGEDDQAGFLEGEVEVVDGLLEVGVGHGGSVSWYAIPMVWDKEFRYTFTTNAWRAYV